MKTEICRRNEQSDLKEKKGKKTLTSMLFLAVECAPVDGVEFVSCGGFLVRGACVCVLLDGAASHLSAGQQSV